MQENHEAPSASKAIGYGCIYIPRLALYFLASIPSFVLQDMRRRKLEVIIAQEGHSQNELTYLEVVLEKKIEIYVLAVHAGCQDIPLMQELQPYDPKALLVRFFAAQQKYALLAVQQECTPLATFAVCAKKIKEYESLITNDVYFKILEKNKYVECAEKKMLKPLLKRRSAWFDF